MKKMYAFDFDNTIYNGDTSKDIVIYSLKKYPFLVLKHIIKTIPTFIKYRFNKADFQDVKNSLFTFLYKINNLHDYINDFVNEHYLNMKKWYMKRDKTNDIIVSASYEIWIKPLCEKVGIKNIIATKTNDKLEIVGKNCVKEEKVNRIKEEYPNAVIVEAYGDSRHDVPMLKYAEKAFVVRGNKIYKYSKRFIWK